MADSDIYTAAGTNAPLVHRKPSGPTVTNLRTALQTFNGTLYTNAYLNGLTKRDMMYAARLAGLTVAGL